MLCNLQARLIISLSFFAGKLNDNDERKRPAHPITLDSS